MTTRYTDRYTDRCSESVDRRFRGRSTGNSTTPTDGRTRRTNGEPWSPSIDISPLVTRTRAYDDDPDVTLAAELAAEQRKTNERGARLVRQALKQARRNP